MFVLTRSVFQPFASGSLLQLIDAFNGVADKTKAIIGINTRSVKDVGQEWPRKREIAGTYAQPGRYRQVLEWIELGRSVKNELAFIKANT